MLVLLRGTGEGLPTDRWLTEVMWPREGRLTDGDVFWAMQFGAPRAAAQRDHDVE